MPSMTGGNRPKLRSRALLRWTPALVRHAPSLATAYLVPGRFPPATREAAMLGVTSVNRCRACELVHGRWAKGVGLCLDDLSPRETAAYASGSGCRLDHDVLGAVRSAELTVIEVRQHRLRDPHRDRRRLPRTATTPRAGGLGQFMLCTRAV